MSIVEDAKVAMILVLEDEHGLHTDLDERTELLVVEQKLLDVGGNILHGLDLVLFLDEGLGIERADVGADLLQTIVSRP